jgi:hypothetical protein
MVTEHLVALGDSYFHLFSSSSFREIYSARVHYLTEIQFSGQFFSCLLGFFLKLWLADYIRTVRSVGRSWRNISARPYLRGWDIAILGRKTILLSNWSNQLSLLTLVILLHGWGTPITSPSLIIWLTSNPSRRRTNLETRSVAQSLKKVRGDKSACRGPLDSGLNY